MMREEMNCEELQYEELQYEETQSEQAEEMKPEKTDAVEDTQAMREDAAYPDEAEETPQEDESEAPDEQADPDEEDRKYMFFGENPAGRTYSRMYSSFAACEMRRRKRAKTLHYCRMGAAAGVLALLAAAFVWLFSTHKLLRVYDQDAVDQAVFLLEESGDAFGEVTDRLLMYMEMACSLETGLPARERSYMIGELDNARRRVASVSAMARVALVRMARSGSVLSATNREIDLYDADALLGEMDSGAQALEAYARMAAEMMTDGALWAEHGADVILEMQDLAEAYDEMALCGQALLYQRFTTEEALIEGRWAGDVCALMVSSSADEIRERRMCALRTLVQTHARLEWYRALLEAGKTERMEKIG